MKRKGSQKGWMIWIKHIVFTLDRGVALYKDGRSMDQLLWVWNMLSTTSFFFCLYLCSNRSLPPFPLIYTFIKISGLLTIITISIIIAHFDSVLCVKKNRIYFSDGSKQERNLLILLIFLSVIALQINTSKYSVGEAQANVRLRTVTHRFWVCDEINVFVINPLYHCIVHFSLQVFFSTWTNFVSCVVNYEVWRKGSGKQHSFQNVLFGHKRHWFLLSVFNTISFLSTIDYFVNNNIITDTHNFQCLNVSWTNKWIWYAFANALICWIVVLLHRHYKKEVTFVRITEFIVVLGVMGINGYVVSSFTGGRLDQVSCPSNLYFSVWGAFFFSVWIFSSMIQESNKA